MLAALAFATLVVAPEIGLPLAKSVQRDYPRWALRAGKSAGAVVSFWVNPDGRVYECEVQEKVGDARLAEQICQLVKGKRVSLARDHNGAAISAHVVTSLVLMLPGTPGSKQVRKFSQTPALEVQVGQLPDSSPNPFTMDLAVEVDPEGRVVACNGDNSANQSLAQIACDKVFSETFPRALDQQGNPMSYVRFYKVGFSAPGLP